MQVLQSYKKNEHRNQTLINELKKQFYQYRSPAITGNEQK